jgi:hypothetical protein
MTIGCSLLPSSLRARIDGTVVRFPGTGDGVARLVSVSIVTFDMAAASTGIGEDSQARRPNESPLTGGT